MKTHPAGEALFAGVKPKVFSKDSYVIKMYFPFAVRHEANGKVLTFPTELKKKGGSWWIFGGYWEVTIEMPICWDNEDEPLSVREAEMVISRLKEALDIYRENGINS